AKLLSRRMPALLIRMSTVPNALTASRTMLCAPSRSLTEPPLAIASPPAALISATAPSPALLEPPLPSTAPPRSFTTTLAPRRASSSACDRPSPPPAPVTMATFPSNRMAMVGPPGLVLARIAPRVEARCGHHRLYLCFLERDALASQHGDAPRGPCGRRRAQAGTRSLSPSARARTPGHARTVPEGRAGGAGGDHRCAGGIPRAVRRRRRADRGPAVVDGARVEPGAHRRRAND